MRRAILVPLLITVAFGGLVGGLALWAYSSLFFYSTNDAQVQTTLVSITSPQAGSVSDVAVKKDGSVNVDDRIATIQVQGKDGTSSVELKTPAAGTVLTVVDKGTTVTRGYPVAVVNQTGGSAVGQATVVAFVDERIVNRLRLGQDADVKIDAYGGTVYTGKVEQIVRQAASQITGEPTADYASGNFTKVGQRVPVLIGLDPGTVNNDLLQGLNAEVTIHLL